MRSLLNPQARHCCNLWSSYQELNRPRIMAKRSDKYFKSRCLCRDLANDAERDQNGQLGPGKERLFNVAGRSARNQDLAPLDWLALARQYRPAHRRKNGPESSLVGATTWSRRIRF